MAALDTLSAAASGIEPREVYFLFKGRLARWQGRDERARAYYDSAARRLESAVRRDSSDLGTLLGLGEAYAARGRTSEAVRLAVRSTSPPQP